MKLKVKKIFALKLLQNTDKLHYLKPDLIVQQDVDKIKFICKQFTCMDQLHLLVQ